MNYKITTLVENCVYGRKLQAEHGLSLYIETAEHKLLFDTGASDLFISNARLLHIDLREVDYLILSHGHSDHTGGLRHFLELNTIATVVCKRSIFLPKFKDDRENGIKHTETFDLSRFRFIDQRTELLPGVVLFPSIKSKIRKILILNGSLFNKMTAIRFPILLRMNWRWRWSAMKVSLC